MIGIYKITSPTGKVYIGQARNIEDRWKYYKRLKCKPQIRLYKSFLKHGVENHIFEVVEECELEQLNIRERYWQDFYDVIDKYKGLNCVLTSTDELPVVMSEETRERKSQALKGKNTGENHPFFGRSLSQEIKDKISKANKGSKRTPEQIQKMKAAWEKRKQRNWIHPHTDKKLSEERKRQMAKITKERLLKNGHPMKGKKHSQESKNKMRESAIGKHNDELNPAARIVIDIETGVFYYTVKEAAEINKIPIWTLTKWLKTDSLNKSNLRYA